MPTRILIILRSFAAGGAERQLLEFLRAADPKRLEITVATFYRGIWHERAQEIPNVSVLHLSKRGRFDVIGFLLRLRDLAIKCKPDIVYGYMSAANLVAALIGRSVGARVAWGIRNSSIPRSENTWFGKCILAISRVASRRADLLIANSNAGARFYSGLGYPSERFTVVHNGIDTIRFRRDPSARAKLRSHLGVREHEKLFGLVSRIEPDKGHFELLNAVAALFVEGERFKVCIVGQADSELASQLRSHADQLGIGNQLAWLGHIDKIEGVYSALDVCVLPSRGEGFPNAIAEAMSCEIPCVATRVGDVPTLVGDTGILIHPDSPNELVDGIRQMLRADVRSLGLRARSRVEASYSVEIMVNQMADAFERLASSGRETNRAPVTAAH